MTESIRHIDLFSCIGGFSYAMDQVFGNVDHTFCEIDPFCQEVLRKHWPHAKIHDDIKTFTNTANQQQFSAPERKQVKNNPVSTRPFVLTGGFPCQPFSQAGRRKGTADDRHLWPEMLRVIQEFHPRWVIGENVGGFLTWNEGLVFQQVHTDLETAGYEVQSFIIPAVSVNAPHRRDRVWIVAHSGQQYGESGNEQGMETNQTIRTTRTTNPERQSKDASNTTSKRLEG